MLSLNQIIFIIEVLLVTMPVWLTLAFVNIAERKTMASKAIFHYYACFNLHYYSKLMLNSTLFKLIFFVIYIFCLFILEMESSFFNILLLVFLFIFYTYRIYCKAKFNLNL